MLLYQQQKHINQTEGLDSRNRKSLAALASMAALMTGTAAAEVPNYNYAELSASNGSVEDSRFSDSKRDTHGYQLEASYALNDNVFFRGTYLSTERNTQATWVDSDVWSVAAGWITATSDHSTFDVSAQFGEDKVDASDAKGAINGPGIIFTVRNNVWNGLELYARGGYLLGEYDGAPSADLGLMWNFSDLLGITASYEYTDLDDNKGLEYKLTQAQLGVRIKF